MRFPNLARVLRRTRSILTMNRRITKVAAYSVICPLYLFTSLPVCIYMTYNFFIFFFFWFYYNHNEYATALFIFSYLCYIELVLVTLSLSIRFSKNGHTKTRLFEIDSTNKTPIISYQRSIRWFNVIIYIPETTNI